MCLALGLAAALITVAAASAASSPDALFRSGAPPHPALVACLNGGDDSNNNSLNNPPLQGTVYRDFVEGRPARLRYWTGRWSTKGTGAGGAAGQQQQQQTAVTLASSLTASRLDQLEAQCALWSGPLSAVVYAPVLIDATSETRPRRRTSDLPPAARQQLDAAAASVAALHARAEASPDGCALDVLLLFEALADARMAAVLPVNAMRNHAILQARTPLVLVADVDLLPARALSRWLQPPSSAANDLKRALEAEDALYVLPAFETPRRDDDPRAAHAAAERAARAKTKAELEGMASRGEVRQFAATLFHEGHDDTQYARWWRVSGGGDGGSSSPSLDGAYALGPSPAAPASRTWKDFEPWFIVARARAPWYDSRFRGYGWNKVALLAHLKALGFSFRVHPAGYLVHRQHERSGADLLYQGQKRAYEQAAAAAASKGGTGGNTDAAFESVAGVTHRLRDEVVAALAAAAKQGGKPFVPALDEGVRACVAALPWWRREELGAGGGGRAVEEALGGGGGATGGHQQQQPTTFAQAFPPSALAPGAAQADVCIGAGEAGEAAVLARVLAEQQQQSNNGGARRRRRRRRRAA